MIRLLLLALLVGCSGQPGERHARPSEVEAVRVLEHAWSETHPEYEGCPSLGPGKVYVWEAPGPVVSSYCTGGQSRSRVLACVTGTYIETAFQPVLPVRFNISWDSGWRVHHRLVQHEAAHVLLGCAVGHGDARHAVSEMWEGALPRAQARFEALVPAPDEPADPYSRPGPPWDLSGTPWEEGGCDVQPDGCSDAGP